MSDNQAINASEASGGAIDPRTGTAGHAQTGERYEAGKENSHSRLDSKDERTLANQIADAEHTEKKEKEAEAAKEEARLDPTLAAKSHGNEPSRGAKKDLEIVQDEEEELRRKDEAKQQSKEAHKH
ncbi:hypothetical protein DB88DRAFT_512727 [Papiliotrema laurentii]|uniref:Uncharacterized protein n=1 Tax=Papiliotrema laurentii TaxID=5418 RepID=A0AAD9FP84_PAPLA|nr:hypothetical protein DB88DRAFT_512727 [Papiliotrema laurentii]